MSLIKFECPHCKRIIEGDANLYGQRVKCPQCQGEIIVPPMPSEPVAKTARLITEPGSPSAQTPAPPEEEKEIFQISPVARAFLGHIFLGLIVIVLGVALVPVVRSRSWSLLIPLVPVIAGVIVLLFVWVKMKSYNYRLTTQRLLVRQGLMAKHIDELELYRVKDVIVDQGLIQRILAYGTVTVLVADDTTPQVRLIGVPKPIEVKETIRTQYRAARKREGVRSTEFMESP